MGKAEIGSAKYISNKLKAKGLSKLKFYCQVCAKQCRDENGFKCHIVSKSHNDKISQLGRGTIDDYSNEFRDSFIKILRLNHGNKFVNANKFYQEFIMDRDHVHLNSTRWKSLTAFCIQCQQENRLQIRQQDGEVESPVLEIRYVDKYKESLIDSRAGAGAGAETDAATRYMQLQVEKNRARAEQEQGQDGREEVKTRGLKDSDGAKPVISLSIKDRKINKCGVVCKPVLDGALEPAPLFRIGKPNLKPRKGNVFKR